MKNKTMLLKRLEVAEQTVKKADSIELIEIHYNWVAKKWEIVEMRFKKGKYKHKRYLLNHYKEYIIPFEYNGRVLLDLIDCPETFQGDVYSIDINAIRKEEKAFNMGISLEYLSTNEGKFPPTSDFDIKFYERRDKRK